MATLEQKIRCEVMARRMFASGGLPEPDVIEYERTCIRAIWIEPKVALVIDIDEDRRERPAAEELASDGDPAADERGDA